MIRLLLVDDHPLMRKGLSDLFAAVADVQVVGVLPDGADAAEQAQALQADVVLMDISMPGVDGITATRQLRAAESTARVVMLTSYAESEVIHEALEAGAVGYLLKDADPEELVRGVREAAAGHSPVSARAATALLPGRSAPNPAVLSDRERQVLELVAEGLPNKSIARRLAISEKTVKAHLTKVFAALDVADRTSAALWAQRHGMSGR